ncbi:permease component [Pseudomonas syringae pv. actinidiae]|uniref:Permease component n=1 Tax=Pseudomonas syringae pv. actinidiae TaxID=103796 RepID=A0A2V0RCZ2_PSESF|nr:permease component [Pseudomonas syringae pv. actinidiae]GBH20568.1 permease component [Pseudomonas syringae pv. actinidiae]
MYHPPARPGTAIKVVGASLLAKGPVQPLKTGRLDHGLREQCGSPPRSHRI